MSFTSEGSQQNVCIAAWTSSPHKVPKSGEKSVWQQHMECKDCSIQDAEPANYRLPKGKEAFIFFKEHGLQNNHPCVVYADFETSNEQFDDGKKLKRQAGG